MTTNFLGHVTELGLGNRAMHALQNDNIIFVGDLVQKTANELLRTPNLGVSTVAEIEATLRPHGLRLGMDLPHWPPANIEAALAA